MVYARPNTEDSTKKIISHVMLKRLEVEVLGRSSSTCSIPWAFILRLSDACVAQVEDAIVTSIELRLDSDQLIQQWLGFRTSVSSIQV